MRLSDLKIDADRLAQICRRYHVARLEAFGSFARGEADAGSDLDILATFEPEASIGFGFVSLQEELEALLGRRVDMLTRQSVECSPNKYFRHYALARTETFYEHAA
jgi:predicted nucleotidyltransferase